MTFRTHPPWWFLLLWVAVTAAPLRAEDRLCFGVSLGPSYASIASDDDSDSPHLDDSARRGVTAGLVVEYPITGAVALQAGLLYSMRGQRSEFVSESLDYRSQSTIKLDYLTLPVACRYRFSSGRGPRPFVKAGPELAILLNARQVGEWQLAGSTSSYDVEAEELFQDLDLGMLFAAGLEAPLSNVTCVVEIGYTLGLTNLRDGSWLSDSQRNISWTGRIKEPQLTNRLWSFSLGVRV